MKARHEFDTEKAYAAYLTDYNATAAMRSELATQTDTYLWRDVDALASRAYTVAEAMVRERYKRGFYNPNP